MKDSEKAYLAAGYLSTLFGGLAFSYGEFSTAAILVCLHCIACGLFFEDRDAPNP